MDDVNHYSKQYLASSSQSRGFSMSSSDSNQPRDITRLLPTGHEVREASTSLGAYYQERTFQHSLPMNNLLYHPSYVRDQLHQNMDTYNLDRMGDITQPIQNVDDPTPHFRTRQSSVMQTLSVDATPDESTSAFALQSLQHNGSLGYPDLYQQQQISQPLIPKSHAYGIVIGAEITEEEGFQRQGPGMEAAYNSYQSALKQIFQNIINRRLREASQSLLEVSEWLLGHVGDLGLTVDEVSLCSDSIRLWGELNTAWLGIFQTQKDILESGQQIHYPETLMTQEFIKKMAKDLIRMCDAVEKHGLVDYQYGVAEEEIIMILSECLDIQESREGFIKNAGMNPEPL